MRMFIIKRLVIAVLVLFTMASFTFIYIRTSGDPRLLLESEWIGAREAWREVGRRMGLDRPFIIQYGTWMINTAKGDVLISVNTESSGIYSATTIELIDGYISRTIRVLIGGFAFAILITVIIANLYLTRCRRILESGGRLLGILGPALPPFLLAIILYKLIVQIDASEELLWTRRGDTPSFELAYIHYYILPCVTLGLIIAYGFTKSLIPSMKTIINLDHKGRSGPEHRADRRTWRIIIRKTTIRLLTSSKHYLPMLLAGLLLTEMIYRWPGVSQATRDSYRYETDFSVLFSLAMVLTLGYLLAWFASEVARACLDPQFAKAARKDGPPEAGDSYGKVRQTRQTTKDADSIGPVFGPRHAMAVVVLAVVITCVGLGTVLREDTYSFRNRNQPPVWEEQGNWSNVLGTDSDGRDRLRLMLISAKRSFSNVGIALAVSAICGVTAGYISARFGGMMDRSLIWLSEYSLTFPVILAVFAAGVGIGHGVRLVLVIFLLAMITWGRFFWQFRGLALDWRNQGPSEQFEEARTRGKQALFVEIKQLAPSTIRSIIAVAFLSVGSLIMLDSIFGYLFGYLFDSHFYFVDSLSWGESVYVGSRIQGSSGWAITLLTGVTIFLTVLSLNLLGEWVRERFNPQHDHRKDIPLGTSA